MSIEAITWALSVPVGGNQKVILLGLANHAHPDGSEAYPALDTLAKYAACDRSTARRNVRKLVADGWAIEDGLGPKGQTKYRLPLGGLQNATPSQIATGGVADAEGVASELGRDAEMPPEPSIEPSIEPSTSSPPPAARAKEPDWRDVPDGMRADGLALVHEQRVKVGTRVVTEREMAIACSALAEFNRQLGARNEIGSFYKLIVARAREHPSWDATAHVRLVRSAFRLKWWERRGDRRRARPVVIWSERAFPNVVDDATREHEALQEAAADRSLRDKVWPDGRRWDELTEHQQRVAKEALAMGIRPWEAREAEAVTAAVGGNGNGHRVVRSYTPESFAEPDEDES